MSPASFVSIVGITNSSRPLQRAAFLLLPRTVSFRTSPASQLQRSRGTFRSRWPPLDTYSNPRSAANHNSDRLDSPSTFRVPRYQGRPSQSPAQAPCPPAAAAAHARLVNLPFQLSCVQRFRLRAQRCRRRLIHLLIDEQLLRPERPPRTCNNRNPDHH